MSSSFSTGVTSVLTSGVVSGFTSADGTSLDSFAGADSAAQSIALVTCSLISSLITF
ncbi:MAG: hypothetical protein RBT05_02485 [Bacteroidales bacterium]|nr:hypothetical protein [Bacteroidales bacterium]